MNLGEFRTRVAECIADKLGDKYKLIENNVIKNNGLILYGLTLQKEGRNVSPTIYLERYKDRFDNGETIDEIADCIIADEEESWDGRELDVNFFTDFDKVKTHLYVKLINSELNDELLREIPNRPFMDLSIVIYCDMQSICNMEASILIRNEHLNSWDVDADKVMNIAYDNTKKNGCRIEDLQKLVVDKMEINNAPDSGFMYVMSNEKMFNGAVCMTFDDKLDEICANNNTSYYIIPSSIHEVLLVDEKVVGEGPKDINTMIKLVNKNTLSREEVLSDHAYYYSTSQGYVFV